MAHLLQFIIINYIIHVKFFLSNFMVLISLNSFNTYSAIFLKTLCQIISQLTPYSPFSLKNVHLNSKYTDYQPNSIKTTFLLR
jgi:hypothetical protein